VYYFNDNTNLHIEPAAKHCRLVRIAKRLVRFNMADGASENVNTYTRRMQYSCEKCGKTFGSWKNLRQHKVESHSY
jgi:hypothetical protein